MSETLLTGMNVLVADDEKFSRQIVINHLRGYGDPKVEQAQHGGEALAILSDQAKRCDMVILDVVMPGVNGLTVLKAIRVGFNNIRRDLPVIMLTGNADADLVSSALRLDVDAFVVKPVSKVAFAARLAKVLGEPRAIRPVAEYIHVPTEDLERKGAGPEGADLAAELGGREVAVTDVQPGAKLARDLRNGAHAVILQAGMTLNERYILRLRELAAMDPALAKLWVV